MKILVCLKQILDPEMPSRDFKLDAATKEPVKGNAKYVMDSYAENGLEVALQLREKVPGAKVIALAVADKPADEVLRRALAMTADEAVRAWDPAWTNLDGAGVARVLAAAILKLGGADLVLLGRQAGDVERGVVGPMLAEELGFSCATIVSRVGPAGDGKVQLWREVQGGVNVVEAAVPVVASITNDDANVPRLPKVKDLMMATRKPITVLGAAELSLEAGSLAPRSTVRELFIPAQDGTCEIVEGDDGAAKVENLTRRLQELKVV